MLMVPAFCDSCGAIFGSGIGPGIGLTVTFDSCTSQCPICGEMARIPDGTYDFIDASIRLISGPYRSLVDLRRLEAIMRRRQQKATPADVEAEINKEIPIVGRFINKWGPKTPQEFCQYAMLIVMIAAVYFQSNIQLALPDEVQTFFEDFRKASDLRPSDGLSVGTDRFRKNLLDSISPLVVPSE